MKVIDALQLVIEMARANELSNKEADTDEFLEEAVKQKVAIDTVEDFAVNVVAEDRHLDQGGVMWLAGNFSVGYRLYGPYRSYDEVFEKHEGQEGWAMSIEKED